MTEHPPWSWTPCKDPVWTPPEITEGDKALTVVTWNAGYRESRWLELSFECLARQQDRDAFEFIHLDWGSEPTPEALKHDFINVVCMGLPRDPATYPSFDSGIQWSLAMYMAQTPYVMFFHNDIIVPDQLVRIQRKIQDDPECGYFEGYGVNDVSGELLRTPEHREEFEQLLLERGEDFVFLPDNYENEVLASARINTAAYLLTVHRETLNEKMGGWFWNLASKSEGWIGPGLKQPIYGGESLRTKMVQMGIAKLHQDDMRVFSIPHGQEYKRETPKQLEFMGGIKHWAEFVSDWLPQHPYRIVSGPRAG